ncbi:hypothetical protein F2Q69_00055980 [Brassica cretica]|uniref:Uncharacterized protein n=1 Tax=Brassica cretica TaxID=69181 RepID=A0A8S9MNJ4_BRACR|nr:hypothetical protein F2Q69_00055980 [Brassica cretica]
MGVMMRPKLNQSLRFRFKKSDLELSGYHSGGGGGYGGGGVDVVVMKVTVALVVNVVVDEDLVVSGCVDVVDVVDVTGRVVDGALGGGYESGNRGRGDTGGVVDGDLMVVCVDVVDVVGRFVDEDFMVSGSVDVVDMTERVANGALGDGYESGGEDSGGSGDGRYEDDDGGGD